MLTRHWSTMEESFRRWISLATCMAILITSVLAPAAAAASSYGAASSAGGALSEVAALAPSPDPLDEVFAGALLGHVVEATDEQPLAGVQVVAEGVLDALPLPIYLPLLLAANPAAAPGRGIRVHAMPVSLALAPSPGETAVFTTTTDAQGDFLFAIPAGDYTLTFTHPGYTPDQRSRPVRANEVLRLDDTRLHPQDPVVTEVGSAGGSAQNSLGNSSLSFPPGAVAATEDVRVTYVANPDLPGFFPDGSAPMGFSSFEPEGAVFPAGKEVLWTVEYSAATRPAGTPPTVLRWRAASAGT